LELQSERNAGPKRETRAERQARTRAELIATAATVFAQRGYEGASVEEIAEQAGYSHGAVYSNFAGKSDLTTKIPGEEANSQTPTKSLTGSYGILS